MWAAAGRSVCTGHVRILEVGMELVVATGYMYLLYALGTYIYIYIYIYMFMYVQVCVYMLYVLAHTYMYMYICSVYVCLYRHVCTFVHTYMSLVSLCNLCTTCTPDYVGMLSAYILYMHMDVHTHVHTVPALGQPRARCVSSGRPCVQYVVLEPEEHWGVWSACTG